MREINDNIYENDFIRSSQKTFGMMINCNVLCSIKRNWQGMEV